MSVRVEAETAYLVGDCYVEDAEPLLAFLQSGSGRLVDVTEAVQLHTAVVQVLLAFRPSMNGPARDAFLEKWLITS